MFRLFRTYSNSEWMNSIEANGYHVTPNLIYRARSIVSIWPCLGALVEGLNQDKSLTHIRNKLGENSDVIIRYMQVVVDLFYNESVPHAERVDLARWMCTVLYPFLVDETLRPHPSDTRLHTVCLKLWLLQTQLPDDYVHREGSFRASQSLLLLRSNPLDPNMNGFSTPSDFKQISLTILGYMQTMLELPAWDAERLHDQVSILDHLCSLSNDVKRTVIKRGVVLDVMKILASVLDKLFTLQNVNSQTAELHVLAACMRVLYHVVFSPVGARWKKTIIRQGFLRHLIKCDPYLNHLDDSGSCAHIMALVEFFLPDYCVSPLGLKVLQREWSKMQEDGLALSLSYPRLHAAWTKFLEMMNIHAKFFDLARHEPIRVHKLCDQPNVSGTSAH